MTTPPCEQTSRASCAWRGFPRSLCVGGRVLAAADTLQPGCLLLDITLPGASGLQLQAELNRRRVSFRSSS